MVHWETRHKLASADPIIRHSAVNEVIEFCTKTNEPYPNARVSLIHSLKEDAHHARGLLLESILEIFSSVMDADAHELQNIRSAANFLSGDANRRQTEIERLIREGKPVFLVSLTFWYTDFPIIEAISEVLTKIGTQDALSALETKVNFALKFRQLDPAARQQAVETFAADKSDLMVTRLDNLLNAYEDAPVYEGAIETLAKIGTPLALAKLVNANLNAYWEDSGPGIAHVAGEAVAKVGAPAVKFIIEGIGNLRSDSSGTYWYLNCAASTIGKITDPAAADSLRVLLRHNEPKIQQAARDTIEKLTRKP